MNKYDFYMDLNNKNDSRVLALEMISYKSRVLEFGPANGHLTKFLVENKNCEVDIVELDYKSGKEASKYANKYLIGNDKGNIEKFYWVDEFINEKYDYILFGDVLEHLYNPEKVLNECKKVLKENGSIIVSIPNIAHNSIIIDLINDNFNYNNVGLLDDTHIRFFTYKSFKRLVEKNNFTIVKEKTTVFPVGKNEIDKDFNDIPNEVAKFLKLRSTGDVYQYIFEIKNNNTTTLNLKPNSILYNYLSYYYFIVSINNNRNYEICRGNIFSPEVYFKVDVSDIENITEVKIDFINSNCILENIKIEFVYKDNSKILGKIIDSNFDIELDSKYIFNNNKPYAVFKNENSLDIKAICVEYKIINFDDYLINELINKINREYENLLIDKETIINSIKKQLKDYFYKNQ